MPISPTSDENAKRFGAKGYAILGILKQEKRLVEQLVIAGLDVEFGYGKVKLDLDTEVVRFCVWVPKWVHHLIARVSNREVLLAVKLIKDEPELTEAAMSVVGLSGPRGFRTWLEELERRHVIE